MFLTNNSEIVITRCTFYRNSADAIGGVGVLFGNSSISITDSNFKENEVQIAFSDYTFLDGQPIRTRTGGAIFARQNARILVNHSQFIAHRSQGSGGVFSTLENVTLRINNSFFQLNRASFKDGGAIIRSVGSSTTSSTSNPNIVISNSKLFESKADAFHFRDVTVWIEHSNISNNQALVTSLFLVEGISTNVIIKNSTLFYNEGIAIVKDSGNLTLMGCFLDSNSIYEASIQLLSFNGFLQLTNCEVRDFSSSPIYFINTGPHQAILSQAKIKITDCIFRKLAIGLIDVPSPFIMIRNILFLNNFRVSGTFGQEPIFNLQNSTITCDNCTLIGTSCQIASIGTGGFLSLKNSFLSQSDVRLYAKVLLEVVDDGQLVIENSVIEGNLGKRGAVVSIGTMDASLLEGRPSTQSCSYFRSFNTIFQSNIADYGGIFWIGLLSNVVIQSSQFINNTANFEGGVAIINEGAAVSIEYSLFQGNSAQDAGGVIVLNGTDSSTYFTFVTSFLAPNSGKYPGNLRPALLVTDSIFTENKADTGGAFSATELWSGCQSDSYKQPSFELNHCNFTLNQAKLGTEIYWKNAITNNTGFRCDFSGDLFPPAVCSECSINSSTYQAGPPYKIVDLSPFLHPSALRAGAGFDLSVGVTDRFGQLLLQPIQITLDTIPPNSLFLTTAVSSIQVTTEGVATFAGVSVTGQINSIVTVIVNVSQVLGSDGVSIPFAKAETLSVPITIVPCSRGFGYTTDHRGVRCEECPVHTYNWMGDNICLPCPAGSICLGADKILTAAGYWWDPNTFQIPQFYQCSSGACCPNGFCPLSSSLNESSLLSVSPVCGFHRYGRLCSVCESGYSEWGGQCALCTKPVAVTASSSLTLLTGLYVVLSGGFQTPDGDPTIARRLYFFQAAALIINDQNSVLRWLNIFLMDMDFLSSHLDNHNTNSTTTTTCLANFSASQQLQFRVITPLILFCIGIAIFSMYGMIYGIVKCVQRENMSEKWPNPKDVYISGSLQVFLYSFIPFIRACLSFLVCDMIGNANVLVAAPSLQCNENPRTLLVGVALGTSLLLVPFFLLHLFSQLQSYGFEHATNKRRYGNFYYYYYPNTYWFGFIILMSNTILVIITVTLLKFLLWKIFVQEILLLTLTFLFIFYQPYKQRKDNHWEVRMCFGLFFLCVCENASFKGTIYPPEFFSWNLSTVLQLMIIILIGVDLLRALLRDAMEAIRSFR